MLTRRSEHAENAPTDCPHQHGSGQRSMSRRLLVLLLVAAVLGAAACGATKQGRTVERLGFLKDLYPKMVEGNEDAGESLLIYRNPRVAEIPPNTYKKVMLDPVMIFRGPDSKMEGISQEQAQLMADTFYALIYQEISKDYQMAD